MHRIDRDRLSSDLEVELGLIDLVGLAGYADNVARNGDQKTGSDSVRGARAMEHC